MRVIALISLAATFAFAQSGSSSDDGTPAATLLFPPNRGSHRLSADIAPCQDWALGLRVDYPLTGGTVSWAAVKDIHNVQLRYSTSADPKSQDEFETAVSNGVSNITGGWTGQQCINGPDFSSLGLKAGDQVTMQFTYKTGPGKWDMYECADLNMVTASDFTAGNWDTQCKNRASGTQKMRTSAANPNLYRLQQEASASAAAEANKGKSKLTKAQSGVIGAMVTLAVAALAIALAYFAGVVAFGKKAKTKKLHRAHSSDSADVKTFNSA